METALSANVPIDYALLSRVPALAGVITKTTLSTITTTSVNFLQTMNVVADSSTIEIEKVRNAILC